ncbi:MAG: phospholipase D-like domain-containing protein [Chloroflexota bacterium]
MTKTKPKKKAATRKKSGATLGGALLTLIILGVLAIGAYLGLFDVNWQVLFEEGDIGRAIVQEPVAVVEPVGGEWYRLYFTSPQYPDEPARRVDLIEQGLIEVIDRAQHSLDIAIYELDLDKVADAVLAARRRGVNVRLVTDTDSLETDDALIRLAEAGLPLAADERGPIMHNKFVVVDGQAVWTGSWNFTQNDTFRNNNHAIYIQSSQLARNYAAEFEEMFGQKAFGPTSPANTPQPQIDLGGTLIETCFAPEDHCAGQLIERVRQARQNIRFMAFSFTHTDLGEAVRQQAGQGVTVQGVFETRGSETKFSEFGAMQRQGLDVWQDGNPYTLHHKVFILDEQTVVLGSFNFSDNADTANDENMLVIHNADIAGQFLAEFRWVYSQAQNPPSD